MGLCWWLLLRKRSAQFFFDYANRFNKKVIEVICHQFLYVLSFGGHFSHFIQLRTRKKDVHDRCCSFLVIDCTVCLNNEVTRLLFMFIINFCENHCSYSKSMWKNRIFNHIRAHKNNHQRYQVVFSSSLLFIWCAARRQFLSYMSKQKRRFSR